jgi:hypothetical protein
MGAGPAIAGRRSLPALGWRLFSRILVPRRLTAEAGRRRGLRCGSRTHFSSWHEWPRRLDSATPRDAMPRARARPVCPGASLLLSAAPAPGIGLDALPPQNTAPSEHGQRTCRRDGMPAGFTQPRTRIVRHRPPFIGRPTAAGDQRPAGSVEREASPPRIRDVWRVNRRAAVDRLDRTKAGPRRLSAPALRRSPFPSSS